MELVAYESSDDDDDDDDADDAEPPAQRQVETPDKAGDGVELKARPGRDAGARPLGPALGPARPPPGQLESTAPDEFAIDSAPRSPYTAARTLLRDLSLPAMPNMDIPASPPGTPPASSAALTKKFEHFLELKRTKGVHFNARLAGAAAVRNPALMDRLLGFAGLEGDARGLAGQYVTTLPGGLGWDPAAFPESAKLEALSRTQEATRRERERRPGEPLDFVSGSGAVTAGGGGGGGGGDSRCIAERRKTRFDA